MNQRRVGIDTARLHRELVSPQGPYAGLDVVASTGSTNADLRAAVAEGAADRTALLAEEQTAGVGRRGRSWSSPAGTGLYCSVLLRPAEVPFARLGSLAVVAGLAVLDVATGIGVDAVLKWPNDVLAGPEQEKVAGILSEAASSDELAVVLGMGINVLAPRAQAPPGPGGLSPTSLAEQGATTTDRTEIGLRLLTALARREAAWRAAGGDLARSSLLSAYRECCATLGQDVKVTMPDGTSSTGLAVDVDPAGQLVLETEGTRRTIFAGDVMHLRLNESP